MRRPDWRRRLDAEIRRHAHRRFDYGHFDCVLFAADAVAAMTGVDHAAAWRAQYHGARAAWRIVTAAGGLAALVTERLGEPIAPRAARRGDVVLLDEDGGSLGICVGADAVLPARPFGLARRPLTSARCAWRI